MKLDTMDLADVIAKLKAERVPFDCIYQTVDTYGNKGPAYYFNVGHSNNYAVWFPQFDVQTFDAPRKDGTPINNRSYVS